MIRRPPRSTQSRSSAASDVYKRQVHGGSEDEDDEIEDIPHDKIKQKTAQRGAVSAEVYGVWNKKEDFKPRVIKKTDEQKKRITARLSQAFMFSALEDKDREVIINAFEEKRFKKGQYVIQQGQEGDELYVVESGTLKCLKKFPGDTEPRYLKTYQPGESFGELALLYNAPRAATIQAENDCLLYALDRGCFNNIVKEAAIKKRQRYDDFLQRVDILQSMDPYERSKIGDAVKTVKFKKGDYVVKLGDTGNTFYFVEDGEAVATKPLQAGGKAEVVYEYKGGDYFGELSLLRNIPRQANIIAKTDLTLVCLDRDQFTRLLGPLEDILRRNFTRYEKYM
eukprot:TRINITY_DN5497_c0_g1_i2.p1 TRINITY_DN5497_c0_g1~~TRINITY_DN5497_c0_g1_i2.p1  ORF type:complete len:338 (+),score=111.67 TRINITY_DN5497_c0_g1_i2:29-1042(+)